MVFFYFRDHLFGKNEKFSEKLTFLTYWYSHVRTETFCTCTKWMIPYMIDNGFFLFQYIHLSKSVLELCMLFKLSLIFWMPKNVCQSVLGSVLLALRHHSLLYLVMSTAFRVSNFYRSFQVSNVHFIDLFSLSNRNTNRGIPNKRCAHHEHL